MSGFIYYIVLVAAWNYFIFLIDPANDFIHMYGYKLSTLDIILEVIAYIIIYELFYVLINSNLKKEEKIDVFDKDNYSFIFWAVLFIAASIKMLFKGKLYEFIKDFIIENKTE